MTRSSWLVAAAFLSAAVPGFVATPRVLAAQAPTPAADSVNLAPVLTEQSQARLQSSIRARYSQLLHDAGVSGSTTARFEVLVDGSVRRSSIRIIDATHDTFRTGARSLVAGLRFVPARRADGPVSSWVEADIVWQPERGSRIQVRPVAEP